MSSAFCRHQIHLLVDNLSGEFAYFLGVARIGFSAAPDGMIPRIFPAPPNNEVLKILLGE
jgi:amino acid transporter